MAIAWQAEAEVVSSLNAVLISNWMVCSCHCSSAESGLPWRHGASRQPLKLDGLAGRATHAAHEAVAAGVEFGSVGEVVVKAGAFGEIAGHADDAAAGGAVGENLLLQTVPAFSGSSSARG